MKVIGLVGVPIRGLRREINTIGEVSIEKTGNWA